MNLDEIYDVILLTFNNQDTRYVIENKKINNNKTYKYLSLIFDFISVKI